MTIINQAILLITTGFFLFGCNTPSARQSGVQNLEHDEESNGLQVHALGDSNCQPFADGLFDFQMVVTTADDPDATLVEFKMTPSQDGKHEETANCYLKKRN